MYEYLGLVDEIQVPDVNCPNVRGEQFTFYKERDMILATCKKELIQLEKLLSLRSIQTHFTA